MSLQKNSIPTVSLADVWREPSDPRWEESYEKIKKIFDFVARRHPRIQRISDYNERKEECTGLLHAFWCHLASNRRALEAQRVRNGGAIRVEIFRFLDKADSDGIAVETHHRLLKHIRNEKVVPTLKKDKRFFQSFPRGPWMLVHWGKETSETAKARSDDDIIDSLPELPSRFVAQRSDQIPPLVDTDLLPDFLFEALDSCGQPRRDWDLAKMVWRRLRPQPESSFLLKSKYIEFAEGSSQALFSDVEGSPDILLARKRWAQRVDIVASRFVDSLSVQRKSVVVLANRQTPHKDIEKTIGISRATIHNELKRFKDSLRILCKKEGLEEHDARILVSSILDILGAEGFTVLRGGV